MILYDKNSNFLGMSQNELSMLGYEDMEEFKSNFSDFADLFVNHPGYISKFKNFSWIDYTLHSGAPNKNILLKHKNGTEIEAKVTISEVSLINKIDDNSSMYCVEISTTLASTEYDIKTDIDFSGLEEKINANNKVSENEEEEQNDLIQTFEDILSENKNESIKDKQINNSDEISNENIHLKIGDNEKNDFEDDFKLHIEDDFDIHQEIPLKKDSEEITVDDEIEEADKPLKLKVVFDEDDSLDDTPKTSITRQEPDKSEILDIKEESILSQPIAEENIKYDSIDFMTIAEDTGMDLSDIAEIMEDFIKESEEYIEKTNMDTLDLNFIKNEAMKLKGIALNLKINNITNTLSSVLENSDVAKGKILLESFKQQINNLKEQLS